MRRILGIAAILVLLVSTGVYWYYKSLEPKIIWKTSTNYTEEEQQSNYTDTETFFKVEPKWMDYYWIKYNNNTIYLSVYTFRSKEDATEFLFELLYSPAVASTKNISIQNYNGTLIEVKVNGKVEKDVILQENEKLIIAGGEELNSITKVVEWFVENYW